MGTAKLGEMGGYVYILASATHGTLYVGVTSDLGRRIWEHREGGGSEFCRRYEVHRLVRYEPFDDIVTAIAREKRLKKWPRAWKIRLIEADNPGWDDLYERLNADGAWAR
jgi:putative endonuclease